MSENDVGQSKEPVDVPVAWEALEDAFENNAPEVHSYLHFDTGEVIRIVDGVADPSMHTRIMSDSRYLRIDPVSSREQYRWMERFIATAIRLVRIEPQMIAATKTGNWMVPGLPVCIQSI